jgi:hypothetical protein
VLLVAVSVFPQAGTTAAIPEAVAKTVPQQVCEGGFYLVHGRTLLRFGSDGAHYQLVSHLPLQVNALGFARDQHLFYAIGNGRIVTIDETGRLADRGPAPRGTRDAFAGAISGNRWYVRGNGELAVINIQRGSGYLSVVRKIRLSAHPYLADWDVNPTDGYLYGVDTAWFGGGRVVKVNPSNGKVSIVSRPKGLLGSNGYGAAAIYGGVLSALHNSSGRMVHISLSSPQKLSWTNLGLRGINADAASCPRPKPPPPPPPPPKPKPRPTLKPTSKPTPKPSPKPSPKPAKPAPAATYYQPEPSPSPTPPAPKPSPPRRHIERVAKPLPPSPSKLPLTLTIFVGLLVPALIVAARGAIRKHR